MIIMNKKMFIICVIFALISSCKNYASSEDLKQNVKEQVKGLLKKDLMQSDYPNNILFDLNPLPTLPVNSLDNAPILKTTQNGVHKEDKGKEDKGKEDKGKEEQEREEEFKRRRREKYKEDQKKMEERKKQLEKRRKEREEESKENPLEKITRNKIKEAVSKIDIIIRNIDDVEREQYTTGKSVEDNVTYPIYDDITDAKDSIYSMWGESIDDTNIYNLFKNLRNARSDLRSKIKNDDDINKNIVKVSDIKGDLGNLKIYLVKIKEYLENSEKEELILKAIKCGTFNEDCY
ncbi:Erp42 protein (plasmid) [Borreliella finlandensis]|uniref:Erp42 protein n=2 Tax=Borreliella finlandensis TaxID=498741 RepID=A0A806CN12_9SPIR|nr:Erp42 protein [Borreliella finlandensis]